MTLSRATLTGGMRFEDHGEIGRGGASVVHKGYDPLLRRHTALKILNPARDPAAARDRFLEEARTTGQLEHPQHRPPSTSSAPIRAAATSST